MITVHIRDALDFFRIFLFLFICRFSCIDIHLHVLFFFIGLNHLRSTHIRIPQYGVRNRKQLVVRLMVLNLKLFKLLLEFLLPLESIMVSHDLALTSFFYPL